MRTVEEIKADVASCDSSWIDSALCRSLRCELYETILDDISIDRLEQICAAERDGQLYTLHDVAVILASAIGDDCACNINSNDEWLPQVCELQEACPDPVGVACWEQYLKHRAEAEKALGKEQG